MNVPLNSSFRNVFLDHYERFRKRLSRRLGSEELANDALQETWLKIERLHGNESIGNPVAYLFRMALNIAADQRDANERLLTGIEVEALLDESRQVLDPSSVVSVRADVALLSDAISRLPRRQREILTAARVDEMPLAEIARQQGISVRMVGKELKTALQFCGKRVERDVVQRFGPGAGTRS